MASLYIHAPFCHSLCDYCDFYSVLSKNDSIMDAYIEAVKTDIQYQIQYFNTGKIETAYIGGGTPSVLGAKRMGLLFDFLNALPSFTPDEFTVEVNPESVNREFLDLCRQGGVNRVSAGVQTFHEPSRREVNRMGNIKFITEALELISNEYSDNFSVDIITGLPFQNDKSVQYDIEKLLDYNPVHISLYSLTIENDTPLHQKIHDGIIQLPDVDSLWLNARDLLQEAGYDHYEVSNFSLPGKQCAHNVRYWQMESWLGAGPAASGTIIDGESARRLTWNADINAYLKNPLFDLSSIEHIDKTTLMKETIMMGFRYKDGPNSETFKKRFGMSIDDCIPKTLERWQNKMLFLNSFVSDAFLELDSKYI
jgi:oxygen-independent coproporphyrinogen-3 oxidase